MSNNKIINQDLKELVKKFAKSDVIREMEKEYKSNSVKEIESKLIDDNLFLKKAKLSDTLLKNIGETLKKNGFRTPLIVRSKKDHYEIVLGRKRLLAAKLAKISPIPCIVLDVSDEDLLFTLLSDINDHKERNIVEMALVLEKIIRDYNYSQNSVATLIHISRPQVTNIVRLLTLPDSVLSDLSTGKLTYGHAKALVALPEDVMQDLLKRIYADNLSVHDIEKLVYAYKHDVNDDKFKKKIDSKYHCDSSYAKLQVTFKFESENERDKFLAELLQNKSKKRAPRPRKPSVK